MDTLAFSEWSLLQAVASALWDPASMFGAALQRPVRQQEWMRAAGWTRWCIFEGTAFLLYCLALIWEHLMRFLKAGRDSLCRLTQPHSLSCRNAETSFSDWLNQVLRGIHFLQCLRSLHLNPTWMLPHIRGTTCSSRAHLPPWILRGCSQEETTYRVCADFSIPRWVTYFWGIKECFSTTGFFNYY